MCLAFEPLPEEEGRLLAREDMGKHFQAEEIHKGKMMKAQRQGAHRSAEQKIPLFKNTRLNLPLQASLEKSYGLTKRSSFQILTIILLAL